MQRNQFLYSLVDALYSRTEGEFKRGCFRVKGDSVDVFPAYSDFAYRIVFWGDEIEAIEMIDPSSGATTGYHDSISIFPATNFLTTKERAAKAIDQILADMVDRCDYFNAVGRHHEANRLRQEREAYLRALASLRGWRRMKIDDPDDVSKAAKWLEENPNQKGGLFGRGQYLKEYMVDWPRRGEIYAELDAMDAEIAKLRQPVPHKWTLRQVESGERDYVPAKKVTEKVELFNGKDLSGWYKYLSGRGRDNDPLGVFSVKDGVISIHGLSAGCITTKEATSWM